jgi:ribosomally synthesized peptide (two-chain TOMM family)
MFMSDNAAPFPRLRTAYLRAIARAWRDPAYMELLFKESVGNPRGVLPLFEKTYNFTFPFDVKFAVDGENRPYWKPTGTTGWFGCMDDFYLSLPAKPVDPKDQAAVLARYCAEFPSLLGAATNGTSEAPPDFAAFGVITSRLLALAWSDPEFHEQLYAPGDRKELVQQAMNYIVQWNFRLMFKEHKVPGSDTTEYWSAFPRSEILVHLPEIPVYPASRPIIMVLTIPDDVQAIALAAYNATGSPYPFTCG